MASLAEHIEAKSIPEPNSGCWLWLGEVNSAGYGRIARGNPHYGYRTRILAHRASYEIAKGSIPDGMELDHLCRVRSCVNPDHLEPVNRSENNSRGDLMKRKGIRLADSNERWSYGLKNCWSLRKAKG